MDPVDDEQAPPRPSAGLRILTAFAIALAFALGVYLLLDAARAGPGLVSFAFLLVLPGAISAFVAYVSDPYGTRGLAWYLMIPVWILLLAILAGLFLLREGVICILILSPLWLVSGLLGAWLTRRLRIRASRGRTYCAALLLLPLLVGEVEPMVPLPQASLTVTRDTVVDAPVERIWPLLRGIPDVRPGEGAWTLSQNVIGLPRPLGARLVGEGVGAERLGNWGADIRFRERITQWQPGRRIGWRFFFDDLDGWRFTDRHLMPDSPYFRVTEGGYTLAPLGSRRTRVRLETRYWIRTPVNAYSALWGELFLGDLETNLLALVKQRAEREPG